MPPATPMVLAQEYHCLPFYWSARGLHDGRLLPLSWERAGPIMKPQSSPPPVLPACSARHTAVPPDRYKSLIPPCFVAALLAPGHHFPPLVLVRSEAAAWYLAQGCSQFSLVPGFYYYQAIYALYVDN